MSGLKILFRWVGVNKDEVIGRMGGQAKNEENFYNLLRKIDKNVKKNSRLRLEMEKVHSIFPSFTSSLGSCVHL